MSLFGHGDVRSFIRLRSRTIIAAASALFCGRRCSEKGKKNGQNDESVPGTQQHQSHIHAEEVDAEEFCRDRGKNDDAQELCQRNAADDRDANTLNSGGDTTHTTSRHCHEGMSHMRAELHGNANRHGEVDNRYAVELHLCEIAHADDVRDDHHDAQHHDDSCSEAAQKDPANEEDGSNGDADRDGSDGDQIQVLLEIDMEERVDIDLQSQRLLQCVREFVRILECFDVVILRDKRRIVRAKSRGPDHFVVQAHDIGAVVLRVLDVVFVRSMASTRTDLSGSALHESRKVFLVERRVRCDMHRTGDTRRICVLIGTVFCCVASPSATAWRLDHIRNSSIHDVTGAAR